MGFRDVDAAFAVDLPSGPKAVFVALAHRADDKTHQTFVGRKALAFMVGMTDRSVSNALRYLESNGRITRSKRRRDDGYRDTDLITVHTVATPPQVKEFHVNDFQEKKFQENDIPTSGEGDSDLRGSSFQASSSKELLVIQGSLNDHSPRANETAFDDFWMTYPKQAKRPAAEREWEQAIQRADPATIVAGAAAWARHPFLVEPRWIPEPANWLKDDRWNDPAPMRELNRMESNLAFVASLEDTPGDGPGDVFRISPPHEDCSAGYHRRLADNTCMYCDDRPAVNE